MGGIKITDKFMFMEETPENMGISSEDIINLIDDFERYDFYTHSFMIMCHGKVAEWFFDEYQGFAAGKKADK